MARTPCKAGQHCFAMGSALPEPFPLAYFGQPSVHGLGSTPSNSGKHVGSLTGETSQETWESAATVCGSDRVIVNSPEPMGTLLHLLTLVEVDFPANIEIPLALCHVDFLKPRLPVSPEHIIS